MLKRIYNDYIMPNRYNEYEKFLKMFLDSGFSYICVKDYKKMENNNKKYIIIRHDIDSDLKIAKKMFEIEKKLGIKSTYYFRKCTINKEFMKQIESFGSEVGYHYEEVAQFCKDNKKIDGKFVENNWKTIKEKMIENIKSFQKENDVKLYSIASHGEWVNRQINISNKTLYTEDMKNKLQLIEAYDIEYLLDYRTADSIYPKCWKQDPKEAIEQNNKKVLVLVHPRWWNKAPLIRLKLDCKRILEGVKYKNGKKNNS